MAALAGGGDAYMDPTPSRLSLWGVYLHADAGDELQEKPNVFRSLCPEFTVAPVRVPRALSRSTDGSLMVLCSWGGLRSGRRREYPECVFSSGYPLLRKVSV